MSATMRVLPRIEVMMFCPARLVKLARHWVPIASEDSSFRPQIKCPLLFLLILWAGWASGACPGRPQAGRGAGLHGGLARVFDVGVGFAKGRRPPPRTAIS